MSIVFQVKSSLPEKNAEGEKVFRAIASSDALDRDEEVLLPRGMISDNFMKNPIMLRIHDNREVSVGKVLKLEISDDGTKVFFDFVFADTEDGKELQGLYEKGFMNAFSVGFYPKASMQIRKPRWMMDEGEDDKPPKSVEVELPNGKTQTVNLTKYDPVPRRIINQWEILEVSPVPIPSNPEALLLRAVEEVQRKSISAYGKSAGSLLSARFGKEVNEVISRANALLAKALGKEELEELSNVISYAPSARSVSDTAFDDDALAAIAAWSSSDGSADKDGIDWSKFGDAFAYMDAKHPDQFTSYRFGHHILDSDELVLSEKGLFEAMKELLVSDLSAEDKDGVYEHLARHYRELDKECPALKTDYSDEELEKISKGESLESEPPADPEPESSDDPEKSEITLAVLKELFGDVNSTIKELENVLRLRMNVISQRQGELLQRVSVQRMPQQEIEPDDDSDGDGVSGTDDETYLLFQNSIKKLKELNEVTN